MKAPSLFFLGSLAAALLVAPARSSAPRQDALQEKYEHKLSLEFVAYGGWLTDYDQARAKAKEEGKVLFTYFSRSYSP